MKIYITILFVLLMISAAYSQDENIKEASIEFLSTLNSREKDSLAFQFEDLKRTEWTNLPIGLANRPGLRYGALSRKSKIKFHNLLLTIFSSQGYLKTTQIMHLDGLLLNIYEIAHEEGDVNEEDIKFIRTLNWGQGNYFISIWGDPNKQDKWAMKFEGHHISLNVTVIDDKVSVTPLFIGSDPALVRYSEIAGLTILSKEEDYGLQLINMLSSEQLELAIISEEVPKDVLTSPESGKRLLNYQGIKGSELTEEQKAQLHKLIFEYLSNLEEEYAHEFKKSLSEPGIEVIYFGWIGGRQRVTDHYYVINGPSFLIEYDNVGWIHKGDHIHTIFRDKKNDFGEDLLKNHHLNHKH